MINLIGSIGTPEGNSEWWNCIEPGPEPVPVPDPNLFCRFSVSPYVNDFDTTSTSFGASQYGNSTQTMPITNGAPDERDGPYLDFATASLNTSNGTGAAFTNSGQSASNWTGSAWIKSAASLPNPSGTIMTRQANNINRHGIGLRLVDGLILRLDTRAADGSYLKYEYTGLPEDTWVHVAIRQDVNIFSAWVNGTKVGEVIQPDHLTGLSTRTEIGYQGRLNSHFAPLNGTQYTQKMDGVKIWSNISLTDEQMLANYEQDL